MTVLQVAEANEDEVYGDVVRIYHKHRLDTRNKLIPVGAICRVLIGERSVLAIARGLPASEVALIRMDWSTRKALGVEKRDEAHVSLQRVGFWSEWLWAWRASDPAYRIASRLAVLSVVLGGVGLGLGIISLFR